jgi:hypothetical protein
MRNRILSLFVIVLGLIGVLVTEPAMPQSKPDLPEIYLYACVYDVNGTLIGVICSDLPGVLCRRTNCVE